MITVSLTTDWGIDGIHVGAFKGRLVQRIPGVQLVDISHQIDPLNPVKAAYAIQNAYQFFAKKTIHIIGVGGTIGTFASQNSREFICFQYNHHYFIGPNNGMWEMVFGEVPKEVFLLEKSPSAKLFNSFPELDVYIETIAKLALGMEPKHLGQMVECALGRRISLPARNANQLLGEFLFFDVFGNGVTNISKHEFYEACGDRKFSIIVGSERSQFMTDFIAEDYSEGDSSKIIALFSFTGYLEISVPKTQLTKFLLIDKNTKILVRFYDSDEEMQKDKGSLF